MKGCKFLLVLSVAALMMSPLSAMAASRINFSMNIDFMSFFMPRRPPPPVMVPCPPPIVYVPPYIEHHTVVREYHYAPPYHCYSGHCYRR